ncbi:uncharacterized mitochondrial protein-like protein [Tanacetum coccineum]
MTVSPLRKFQLIDSDSDSDIPSISEVATKKTCDKSEPYSNRRKCVNEPRKLSESLDTSTGKDLWEDFRHEKSFHIPTPALDEVCEECLSSMKEKAKFRVVLEKGPIPKGIAMTQRKYALDLIEHAGLMTAKHAKTPLNPNIKLTDSDESPLTDKNLYRTLVGKLIYLTITRPDIAFAAQLLSQFSHSPKTSHMTALQRVIRYIKLSPGQGLFFPRFNPLCLQAYCDSDWANCPTSRRSVTGFGIFLGNSLISWQSKKQAVVSRSSTESEYRALADCSCEITWLIALLQDLHIQVPKPVKIFCDNTSAIALASNPVQHARTKHIEIDCHFVREKIKAGQILPTYVSTTSQTADVLTKALFTPLFNGCLSKLGMCDPYTLPTCGGDIGIHNAKNTKKVNSARMGLQMYYMLIKDAVDDAMEIRYKTETIANEARGCKVRGEIYAYYGSDIFNHCCASIRPCYWGLLFRSDVPFALEGDKIPLRKSVLAVPKDAP